jgi:hypothetical protein
VPDLLHWNQAENWHLDFGTKGFESFHNALVDYKTKPGSDEKPARCGFVISPGLLSRRVAAVSFV